MLQESTRERANLRYLRCFGAGRFGVSDRKEYRDQKSQIGLLQNTENTLRLDKITNQISTFNMTTFQGLTATKWRNRINEYNPGMYTKDYLKDKTAKELAQIQNGKSYGNPSKHDKSKPISAIRARLEAIKKEKVCAIKKEKTASDSVQQLLASLGKSTQASKSAKAPVRNPFKAKERQMRPRISSRN
jgi:hypothetical protein